MRIKNIMKKFAAMISCLILFTSILPFSALAAGSKTPPPKEPYQRVLYKNGNWTSEYMADGDKTLLIVGYRGSYQMNESNETTPIKFSLGTDTLLKGIYLPYAYPSDDAKMQRVLIQLEDDKGNIYGPFATIPFKFPKLVSNQPSKVNDPAIMISVDDTEEVDNIFIPEQEILLPAGSYSLTTSDPARLVHNSETGPSGAVMIKGIDYSAWKKYKDELIQWEEENNPVMVSVEDKEAGLSVIGSEKLAENRVNPENYVPDAKVGAVPREASFSLKNSSLIDEIVFNTYNAGKGAPPGTISIVDAAGKDYGKYQTQGALLGNAPNGMWIAAPSIVLPAGTYKLILSDNSVVTYDEKGYPDFYVTTAPMQPKMFNFTGRYFIDLDTFKTSTLRGPVNSSTSSFSLRAFELTVLDKGDTIELIGKYEGMPFSQILKVTDRGENKLTALLNFSMDLSNLPYKAKVGAVVNITLEKPPGLQPKITIEGKGTYERSYTAKYGGDSNTYRVTGKGSMAGKDLPAYVAAALGARINSVGNIPGPDNPFQAATGALFPPLIGLIATIIQSLLKPKAKPKPQRETETEVESKPHEMSVGEKAMAEANQIGVKAMSDANESLGKGLYDEREAKAWSMMADALANSDNPDDDPASVGDNENPGGSDYSGSQDGEGDYSSDDGNGEEYGDSERNSEDYGQNDNGLNDKDSVEGLFGGERERLESERDEWLANLKSSMESADPNDPRTKDLHQQYKDYIEHLNSKINDLSTAEKSYGPNTMTVQVDHTGRTAEIEYDPSTGEWHNTESGNIFDMGRYERDVLPNFEKDRNFIDEQRKKLETRNTDFDRGMDTLVADQKERARILGQLQQIRNQSYGIEPPAEGVGDVQANIDKLLNDLSNRTLSTEELRDRASRITKVVTDRNTGRTMDEDDAKRLTDREMSYTNAAAQTVTEGAVDVITGRTWAGMAGRMGLAVLTGGGSEYVLSPVEALHDIRDSINSGESGTRATLKAMGKYVLGELGGEYMGEAWKRSGLQINPDFVKKAADIGNTPVSKIYSQFFGQGAKSGSKETLEGLSPSTGKRLLGSSDSGLGKIATDTAEYSKYRSGVNNQASTIDGKIRTGENISTDEMRKVLRDPSVSRELKNSHPDVQNGYQDALENGLYKPANNNTSKQLEKDLLADVQKEFGPNAKIKVEVESVRTPGAKGSRINADNDLTGKITITDANGKTITRELPSDKVAKVYNEKFAETSGMLNKDGTFNVTKAKAEMPEGITITDASGKKKNIDWDQATKEQQLDAFAKKHNQEVTDIHSAEAAADFNSAKNASGVSNVGQLKSGVSTAQLSDPSGLAKMEHYKINNYFNKGGIANQTEAYEQLSKMGKLTNDLTGAYQKLGYNAQAMPTNMQKALDVVANRHLSPGARTIELQKLGFDGPGDLANKLSGRIEGLQKLGAPAAGKPANKTLEKVSAFLIKSYLNEDNK